jgi:hypothetical protein
MVSGENFLNALEFSHWGEPFPDSMLTSAQIDRVVSPCFPVKKGGLFHKKPPAGKWLLDATLKKLCTIHIPLQMIQCLPEALEVDDLPLPQEPQNVNQVGIIGEIDQVFIGCPGFFFSCHILMEVSYWITHGVDVGSCPGDTVGVTGVDPLIPDGVVAA